MLRGRLWLSGSLGIAAFLAARGSEAFILHEHIRISQRAVDAIRNDETTTDAMRALLRIDQTSRPYCLQADPKCFDVVGVLPALAADHSCSPKELRASMVAASDDPNHWIRQVMIVVDEKAQDFADAGDDENARTLVRRRLNVDLAQKDDAYVTRAVVDYAHFQSPREPGTIDLARYMAMVFNPTHEANATASFANYHTAALRLAAAAVEERDEKTRADLQARAIYTESFALHFLEDSFSSGHTVGHWGTEGVRLGTHDYYCGAGVEAQQWKTFGLPGEAPYHAHGDGFIRAVDYDHVVPAVAKSLAQVLQAATDPAYAKQMLDGIAGAVGIEDLDSCNEKKAPPGLTALARSGGPVFEILAEEPIPSVAEPAPLRLRAERGVFFGGSVGFEGGYASIVSVERKVEAFGTRNQPENVRARAAVRVGYGAGDLTDDALNGQAFGEVGVVSLMDGFGPSQRDALVGFTFRVRAPGELIFLDGIAAIIAAEASRSTGAIRWAARAGTGGYRGIWRSRPLIGRTVWQISALRDVTLNWFPNEPAKGDYRVEVLAPFLTARYALPIAGEGISQSSDVWLDLGASFTQTTKVENVTYGLFLSISSAGRVFPP